MPISSNADYIPTIDEFLDHWAIAEETETFSVRVGDVMVDYLGLGDVRSELDGIKSVLESRLNDLEIARVTLNELRNLAADRIADFNRRMRALFTGDSRFNKIPLVPTRSAGRDSFVTVMDDAIDIWTRVNALPPSALFTGPLLLHGGVSLAQFSVQRIALDTAFTARGTAEARAGIQRTERNRVQAHALEILTSYRTTVEALFPQGSTVLDTLPALRPAPGHTPEPVAMEAVWNPTETKAEITWEASGEETLKDYQLRAVPGPEYSGEDATVVQTFLPAEPRVFLTGSGFPIPGAAVTYKIFVRLTTGNESGSEPVTVTRPL